jgi:glucosamine-6-phosphate deaminase
MAVPLSPSEVATKGRAVVQHESRKHIAPHFAEDVREPAKAMSRRFDALGLPDYEAIETFHRWVVA